jgi:hypothetical protein
VNLGSYLLWVAIAIAAGILVLLGYFIDLPFIMEIRSNLLHWAVVLAAAAVFMGLLNLGLVHWEKINSQAGDWGYSAILILSLVFTLVLGLILGPDHSWMVLAFTYIQLPVEISLMAIMAVVLVMAGYRLIRQRRDLLSMVFMGTALIVLLGTLPWVVEGDSFIVRSLGVVRAWLTQVWAVAGARGILIGVALGAAATGLRVLIGADRPYGD